MTGTVPTEALAALRRGDLAEAEAATRRALATAPSATLEGFLAHVLHRAERLEDAFAASGRALALEPHLLPALYERSALARKLGHRAEARAALERLAALQPQQAALHADLGSVRLELGELDAARAALERALQIDPKLAEARFKLGHVAYAQARYADALAAYEACLRQHPAMTEAWIAAGETLLKLEHAADAVPAFARAAELAPANIKAHDGWSRALWAIKADVREWLARRERVAELDGSPAGYAMLGMDNWKASRFDAARAAYLHAVELDPGYLPGWWGAFQYPECLVYVDDADVERFLADWRAGLERFERFDFARFRPELVASCLAQATNFYLHYLGQPFVAEQRRYGALLRRMVAAALPGAEAPASAADADAADLAADSACAGAAPTPHARRRVALVSGFVRRHTVMKLFGGLFAQLDRERFELGVFYADTLENEGTRPLREAAARFEMGSRPLEEWVAALRSFAPDVIVYPDIGMHPIVGALAALRLAPVQCMLWGHPVTSGLPTIDHFLSAAAMESDDAAQHYTENLVRLPNLGCWFAPPADAPQPVAELATKPAGVVDAFFAQSAYKIMPFHDDVLARIAAQAPELRLNLVPHPQAVVRERLRQRLRRAFAARGLDFDARVGVFRFVDEREFLGIAAQADLNLDSIGWSGGNTTLEILWFDVPTVTLPGALMRSRHTAAILRRLELDELVARDVDDYVRIAVALARDTGWREALRAKIRERKPRLYRDPDVLAAFADFLATVRPAPAG